jgi:hypothetical protein
MTEYEFETFYPQLRQVLDERFAGLPDDQLEAVFEDAFGEGITPAEYEEFFGGLSKALSSAAPILSSVAQGALKGGAAGSAIGPWGTLGGAVLGGVGQGLRQHTRGPARDVGGALSGVVNTAGTLTGRGAAAQGLAGLLGMLAGGRGGPATNALRNILGRPETSQALGALFSGRNAAIPVGPANAAVPASAFAGLLGALAKEAESEAEASWDDTEPMPGYLADHTGQLVVDPTDPEQRAARLLQILAAGEAEDDDAEWDDGEWDDAEFDDVELDAAVFEEAEFDDAFDDAALSGIGS